jgi:tetratricopeptide (TPR) repeat protein
MKIYLLILAFLGLFQTYAQISDLNNRFLLAQSYEQAGDLQKALSIYEDLFRLQPGNIIYFQSLNRTYIQLKKFDKSINIVQSKLAENPSDINLIGLLGQSYFFNGEEKKTFSLWDECIKKFGKTEQVYRAFANYSIELRAFEKAVEYLKLAKLNSQNPIFLSHDLINLYFVIMQYEALADEISFILNLDPNQLQIIESRILLLSTKPEAIYAIIDKLENSDDKDKIYITQLLSVLYLQIDDFSKAFQLLKLIDEKKSLNGVELFNFAQKISQLENYEITSEVYEYLLKHYPNSPLIPGIKLGYAKVYEAYLESELKVDSLNWKPFCELQKINKSKFDIAIQNYQDIISLFPNSEVAVESELMLGNIYLKRMRLIEEAEKYYLKIITDHSMSQFLGKACIGLAEISVLKNDLIKGEEFLEKAISNPRINNEDKNHAKYIKSKMLFYKGSFSNSKSVLNEFLDELKDNTANDAIELLLLINTSLIDSSQIVNFAQGELFIEQDKLSEAKTIFSKIVSAEPLILKNFALLRIAEINIALNDFEEALTILQSISKQSSNYFLSDKSLFLSAKVYEFGLKDISKAIEQYESILSLFPNSLYLDESREKILELKNIQGNRTL